MPGIVRANIAEIQRKRLVKEGWHLERKTSERSPVGISTHSKGTSSLRLSNTDRPPPTQTTHKPRGDEKDEMKRREMICVFPLAQTTHKLHTNDTRCWLRYWLVPVLITWGQTSCVDRPLLRGLCPGRQLATENTWFPGPHPPAGSPLLQKRLKHALVGPVAPLLLCALLCVSLCVSLLCACPPAISSTIDYNTLRLS